jgi:hypothetical protein
LTGRISESLLPVELQAFAFSEFLITSNKDKLMVSQEANRIFCGRNPDRYLSRGCHRKSPMPPNFAAPCSDKAVTWPN